IRAGCEARTGAVAGADGVVGVAGVDGVVGVAVVDAVVGVVGVAGELECPFVAPAISDSVGRTRSARFDRNDSARNEGRPRGSPSVRSSTSGAGRATRKRSSDETSDRSAERWTK